MKVIDNFLPDYHFKQIQSIFLGDMFPWYWNETIVFPHEDGYNEKDYQFTHILFDKGSQESNHYPLVRDTVLRSLGTNECHRIKMNLNPFNV